MEKKKNNTKKFMLVSAFILVAATILGLVVAYGWAVNVYSENQVVDVNALSGITLNYLDCDSSDVSSCANISKDLAPGDSVDKVFEVTNTTPRDISFNLYFKELYNSFRQDDLVYTLKNITTDEVLVSETPVRFSELKLYDLILKRDITIGGNATNKYKLTIKFLNRDRNQNYNIDASYFIKLSIGKYTRAGIVPKIVASITDNTPLPVDESIKSDTPDFSKPSPVATEYMEFHNNYIDEIEGDFTNTEVEYADSYTFDSKTGLFTLVNPTTCVYSECYETLIGKYTTYPYDWGYENPYMGNIVKIKPYTDGKKVKFSMIRSSIKTYEANDGIYSMEDDYGTSYYFRGTGQNNYVKFAGFYWRIIRINGDGSVRIMYNGTEAHPTGKLSEDQTAFNSPFNESDDDAKYVGYMYGPIGSDASTSKEEAQTNTESSTIKTNLENWYVENIKSKNLDQYVADSIFCYDRSIFESSETESNINLGYGNNSTQFNPNIRMQNHTPIFTCPNKNDAFTVSDTVNGNGALSEKVGLLTIDEVMAAGQEQRMADLGLLSMKTDEKNDIVVLSKPINKSNIIDNTSLKVNDYHTTSLKSSLKNNFVKSNISNNEKINNEKIDICSFNINYNYLATCGISWTGSPYSYISNLVYGKSRIFNTNGVGGAVNMANAVSPVINLTADYAKNLIGSGEIGDEYREPNTD